MTLTRVVIFGVEGGGQRLVRVSSRESGRSQRLQIYPTFPRTSSKNGGEMEHSLAPMVQRGLFKVEE